MTLSIHRLFLLLLPIISCVVCPSAALSQDSSQAADGYVSLFDGRTLQGWVGNPALWSVEDGCIVGKTGAQGDPNFTPYNQFLIYEGDVPENFVLEFDFLISRQGNSGMQFRSWRDTDTARPWRVYGYQADFDGAHTHSGIVYGENYRGILAHRGTVSEVGDDHKPKELKRFAISDDIKKALKVEDWNHYRITVQGWLFIMEINGVVTSILIDDDKDVRRNDGILAIQAHAGPPMKVQLKNIKIKKM